MGKAQRAHQNPLPALVMGTALRAFAHPTQLCPHHLAFRLYRRKLDLVTQQGTFISSTEQSLSSPAVIKQIKSIKRSRSRSNQQ
jgi:hypothetical protein